VDDETITIVLARGCLIDNTKGIPH
jgi:hypothetical protein